jgi:hypothetical protein
LYASFPILLETVKGPRYLASNFLDSQLVVMFLALRSTGSPTAKCLSARLVLYYFALLRWAFLRLFFAASQS